MSPSSVISLISAPASITVCMRAYVCVCMRMCAYACVCMRMCVCACVCARMYVTPVQPTPLHSSSTHSSPVQSRSRCEPCPRGVRCVGGGGLRSFIICTWPRSAAMPSGVTPEPGFLMFTSTPRLISLAALIKSFFCDAMPSLSPCGAQAGHVNKRNHAPQWFVRPCWQAGGQV